MPDSIQALGVFIFAVLPGALYVWSFEREVGPWGVDLADRIYRFIGSSAIFHMLTVPLSFELWRHYIRSGHFEDRISVLALWGIVIAYVAVPSAAGRLVGRGILNKWRWVGFVVGRSPAPRAWEHVFASKNFEAWVRLKLIDGSWIGGAYAIGEDLDIQSYAAGTATNRDLYLATTVPMNQQTGEFVVDSGGAPVLVKAGVLVRWDQVSYCLVERASST